MKKILFGITSLTLGGAERVLVDLANRLSNDYDITIFTIYDDGILKTQLNEKVKTISLYDREFKEYNRIQRILISLRLMFTNKPPDGYDTYIAFLEGPITRLFAKSMQKKYKNNNIGVAQVSTTLDENVENIDERLIETKRIAWVHNDISKVFGNGPVSIIKKHLDKRFYKKYDKIIFVSKENQKDFNNTYGNKFNEAIIRNYLDFERVIKKANNNIELPYEDNDINLLTVCRLEEQKAIERFIKVHAKLEESGIHCKVYIVGDGTQRYSLQRQIDKLNETDKFFLLGSKENPYPYIKNCDYFCLLSYYEGYGMVLDEAKILNKHIIITDTAAKESVENYPKATIVDNTEKGIFEGLKKVLSGNIADINQTKKDEENNYMKINEYYDKIIEKVEGTI